MDKKVAIRELLMVLSSNMLILLSSIFTGLIVPKLLGVSGYGYFKIFTLYTSYTALLHFGFIDGILLEHGADDYKVLNREAFRANSQFFILFQVIIAIMIGIIVTFIGNDSYTFIFYALAFYMVCNNVTTYYQFISQATMRFKELSFRKVLQAIMSILIVLALASLMKINKASRIDYRIYIILYVSIMFILVVWYITTYKDITFGKRLTFKKQRKHFILYFRKGVYLTVAYQVSTLVFNMDSQFISMFFSKVTYGTYAFAYSLIQMVLTVLNAISTVLFPHIKRKSKVTALNFYPKAISYVVMLVYLSMLGYFPLKWFIGFALPEYIKSLVYFQILFPGVGLTCCITLIIFNYYKILNENKIYFLISLGILVWTLIFTSGVFFIFHTAIAIAWSALITLIIWRIVTEQFLVKYYHVKWKKNLVYTLIMMLAFVCVVQVHNSLLSMILYGILYLFFTTMAFSNLIKDMLKQFTHKREKAKNEND